MQSGLKIALKLFNKREYEIKFPIWINHFVQFQHRPIFNYMMIQLIIWCMIKQFKKISIWYFYTFRILYHRDRHNLLFYRLLNWYIDTYVFN